MRFKTDREKTEFEQLPSYNYRLQNLLNALDIFVAMEFGKDICITSIHRTQAEHDALYANTAAAQKPVSSPHIFWEAADIRSTDFTPEEIGRMVNFLNQFKFRNGKNVGMYHQIAGGALHFHIQYAKVRS